MTVKIGINGFGRIGRLAFRRIFELQARGGQAGDIEVAAINDLTTPATLAYLLKYDSTHGTFRHDDGTPVEVTSTEDSIVVDGKEYKVYAEKDANNIPWVKNDGVEFVLECTGFYTSAEKSQAHINAGAKKVLISAPAKDDTTPTVVFGVNHDILKASDVIVSAGSCTTNSMAAMVKLLDEKFGIKAGFMTPSTPTPAPRCCSMARVAPRPAATCAPPPSTPSPTPPALPRPSARSFRP